VNIFVYRQSKKLLSVVDALEEIQTLSFVQTDSELHTIVVTDGAEALDMTGYVCRIGIVGISVGGTPGTGAPTGTQGGPPLAASNLSKMNIAGDGKSFSGVLNCYTVEMAALIGTGASADTKFQVRFTNVTNSDDFSVLWPATVYATAIEDASITPTNQSTTYTKDIIEAKFVPMRGDQARVMRGSDGSDYVWGGLVSDGGDEKWHRLREQWVNGTMTFGPEQTGVDEVP
jgi:hypothetical protein